MSVPHTAGWTRRHFLDGLTWAGAAGLFGLRPVYLAAAPPETRLRLYKVDGICIAPQYVAEELLHGAGFTDVQYVAVEDRETYIHQALGAGTFDIGLSFVPGFLMAVDAGAPIVLLGGIHVGCFELFGTERVRAIRDLKGKTVAVPELGSAHQLFIASMAQYVGINPHKDVHWAVYPPTEAMTLLAEEKIDALVAFPPVPQELRAKKIGHTVVSSAMDRPWSQYFCCMVAANREFVRNHPVATKRALRAILQATDICALQPDRAAQLLVEKGFTPRYDYARQTMQEIPYNRWREYDPEDTVRFYALRLHELGLIKSIPQKIIVQGTDWRFFNELKKELKG